MYIKDIATKAHEGQTRRGNGEPYINHCIRIVENIEKYMELDSRELKYKLIKIAYMHDVIEDCELTPEIVTSLVIEDIFLEVNLLTRKKGQSKKDYLLGVFSSPMCIVIKGLDRIDNLADIMQIKNPVDYIHESKLILAAVYGLGERPLTRFIKDELNKLIVKAEKELDNGNEYSGNKL